eukprot:630711-Pyramimonas_sp.AAC.1
MAVLRCAVTLSWDGASATVAATPMTQAAATAGTAAEVDTAAVVGMMTAEEVMVVVVVVVMVAAVATAVAVMEVAVGIMTAGGLHPVTSAVAPLATNRC